jgi:myo-inositol 2-dehydrogenase/D-chiro-inositol 1-dehydrogenase
MAKKQDINRRSFMAGAGAAAMAFTIASPQTAKTYAANEKISLGLIGSGGRAKWIMPHFIKNGGYNLVACADYFQDCVDSLGNAQNIPAANRYTGLSSYKKLLEQKNIDAVAIMSPPYFHPEHAAAGIEAGKHVYLAKPIAVDVPGCKTIEQTGKTATANKLAMLVDFQTRQDPYFQEALKRVHAGALGKLAFGESMYHGDWAFPHRRSVLASDPTNPENRLRAWGLDKTLSGDTIVEQSIHTLDVMNWIMNAEPLSAVGTGGKVRDDAGNCWDHFVLTFQYADNIGIGFTYRQFKSFGMPEKIINRMYGSKGSLEANYSGKTFIRSNGDNIYKGGFSPQLGIPAKNIADFRNYIIEGKYENSTVPPSVQSNLVTIMGRMAAYQNRKVTWAEMLRNDTKINPKLDMKRLKT